MHRAARVQHQGQAHRLARADGHQRRAVDVGVLHRMGGGIRRQRHRPQVARARAAGAGLRGQGFVHRVEAAVIVVDEVAHQA
ncbi:hypothetical protein RZS08_27510, partial [Arthrospira platensis SPKY1]|nr:hypothetical protein [Arthrospira platensis SPKY1]